MNSLGYRGRFAPSPTGKLHFGSLVAAVASYLDARTAGGEWLLRIENIDPPREVPGSADAILASLEVFGFEWDGGVLYQSDRLDRYRAVVDELRREGLAYPCACSRKEIGAHARLGPEGPIYPGTCRDGLPPGREGLALRLLTHDRPIGFDDRIQGHLTQSVESETGDFVILRADGFFAYQLAVVVDDQDQGITQVVRGCDLLHSTPRQIHLQRLLGYTTPGYAHIPVVLDDTGKKLSKQDLAYPVDPTDPLPALGRVLGFLNQEQPPLALDNLEDWWTWAIGHWQIRRIPSVVQGCTL
ncbi:MAG: tRNA glutamyl-Q(34) synthetase GluQRS [Gammaproteobacteria bacterium]|nr:tRNA glutamyl-Q(34) synthetase GluQRS [Gammaproteobacteria bacterium]MBU1654611.1 tRNA glutamyl-Q(34) synthetase GluQRS [Gammaproteobacteria bacterium]MBU1959941.1 tRNA glutamyl-Q(34) synthetase GluQRS [Gammaproteobacteria bacterium]